MGLIYKFPKLYDYVVKNYLTYVPGAFMPDELLDFLSLDRLAAGGVVLDIACGSGALTFWLAEQRADLQIVGVDISKEMLAQATEKAQNKGLHNVTFINQSALTLTTKDLPVNQAVVKDSNTPLDMIVCSHGFSAMENYQAVFLHALSLLATGGTYLIMDIYYPQRTLFTILTNYMIDGLLFGADVFRKPFLLMQEGLAGFTMFEKPIKDFGFLPGHYYIAKGTKR